MSTAVILLVFFLSPLYSQEGPEPRQIRGRVLYMAEDDTLPLSDAHIRLLGSDVGALTDQKGHFSLTGTGAPPFRLVITHVQFLPDTIEVAGSGNIAVLMRAIRSLQEVSVTGERPDSYIASVDFKTEVITRKELMKAPWSMSFSRKR